MKRINILFMAFGAFLVNTSCNDFLDETPISMITQENYYKTAADAEAGTNAIYDFLIAGYAPAGLWDENFGGLFYNDFWELQELMSDNAVSKQSSAEFNSLSDFKVDSYNSRIRTLWRDFYQTIKACNTVIEKVPAIPMDDTHKNQLIAEAKFFRAMCYFELVRFYGDVPLQTTPVTDVEAANTPRTPVAEIYPTIISDLQFAEQNLKVEARQGNGRPYALSASALLSNVYLTFGVKNRDMEILKESVKKAEAVIPSFPLFINYAEIYLLANRFKGEHIFDVNFSASLSDGWKGNQFLVRLLPKMDTNLGGPANGLGLDAATDNLYNSYEAGDKRRDVTLFKSFTYPTDGSKVTFDAPYFCKFWDRAAEPKGNNSDACYPYLRSAEMYLNKAEALNEINNGPTTEAVEALNVIRRRAGLTAISPTTYSDFKTAILKERRSEFAIEGHRRNDLIRMCTLEEMQAIILAAKPTAQPKKANLLYPIPQRDIDISNGVLKQNTDY